MRRLLTLAALWALAMNVVAQHSPLLQGCWTRLTVDAEGVYRVTVADVPALSGADVRTIALFGLQGGTLSEYNADTLADGLRQCAIYIDDANGNGLFDASDAIIFYGQGPSVWYYDNSTARYRYKVNPYSNHSYYFLTTDYGGTALRVLQGGLSDTAAYNVTTHTALAVMNQEVVNLRGSGQLWIGDRFNSSITTRRYTSSFPCSVPSGTLVDLSFAAASNGGDATYTLSCDGGTVVATSNIIYPYAKGRGQIRWGGGTSMTMAVTFTPGAAQEGYMDYIELAAEVPLAYNGSPLIFREPAHGGNVRYIVSGAVTGLRVWDVTDPCRPVEMELEPDGSTAAFTADATCMRVFVAFAGHGLGQISALSAVSNQDLHGATGAELLIVCHPDFKEQADRLAELHRIYDGMTVFAASSAEVYNEYSSGRQDPMAIRHFLRQKYEAAIADSLQPMPRYLLLFGRGTYDNRNLMGKSPCAVVTWQSEESLLEEGASYSTDDMFGYLEPGESGTSDESMEVGIGRLPAKDLSEAKALVDKIEGYITKADLQNPQKGHPGDWRNSIALLADDADPSRTNDTSFTRSSEYTAGKILERYPYYNIDKIFADAYVQQSGASGSYYPDVNNAVNQRFNNGCMLFNYVGHGSARYIGTEHYIDLVDIARYSNKDRLPVVVGSTCSYGHFDNPDELCGAEEMLLAPAAAIAVFAATRPISHSQRFNTDLCLNILNPSLRLGDALRLSKNEMPYSHSFGLLGDPALRLSFPDNEIVVTKINSRDVDFSRVDSAEVLSQVTVEGEIVDRQGQLMSSFDGNIYPVVYDRVVPARTLANDNEGAEVDFTQQKGVIYKGRHTVSGGRFSYSFTVPRDVAYNYDFGKLSHYASCASGDATGQYSNIMFGGFDDQVNLDVEPPQVTLSLNDSLFVQGGTVGPSPTLVASFFDEVGINAFGSGLGHDITATLDGNPNDLTVLNDFYEPDIEDFRRGQLRYTFQNLSAGSHTLTLKAWNIYNKSATATLDFTVRSADYEDSNLISRFFAWPNPASTGTHLQIEHTSPDSVVAAAVYIYSAMGQLVRVINISPAAGSYVAGPVFWNFTNASGAVVAPGMYLGRAVLTDTRGRQHTATAKILHK